MGEQAFLVLAIALSGLFGGVGILLGLWFGVRSVTRDEQRYEFVAQSVEAIRQDQSRLRVDWGTTLESLEQLSNAVEQRRRRAAASESALKKRDQQAEEGTPRPLTAAEQRDMIRQRMRRVV